MEPTTSFMERKKILSPVIIYKDFVQSVKFTIRIFFQTNRNYNGVTFPCHNYFQTKRKMLVLFNVRDKKIMNVNKSIRNGWITLFDSKPTYWIFLNKAKIHLQKQHLKIRTHQSSCIHLNRQNKQWFNQLKMLQQYLVSEEISDVFYPIHYHSWSVFR
jgi:hypothetical protein